MKRAEVHLHKEALFEPFDLQVRQTTRVVIHREVLPIVVVPGIMGSRLRLYEDNGRKAWDPDDLGFMFWNYGRADAEKRQRRLFGEIKTYVAGSAFVDNHDKQHNERFAKDYPDGEARGWGGVAWNFYGKLLRRLHDQKWPRLMQLTCKVPVYAFGYDWRGSNREAGAALKTFIDELTKQYPSPGKVILVTHSMGGLVARSAMYLSGAADKVMGVVHGAQPAAGAAVAYWRMRAGFKRELAGSPLRDIPIFGLPMDYLVGTAGSWVLGEDALEVQSLLGHLPGGLELLPNKLYEDSQGRKDWLTVEGPADGEIQQLPRANPYQEIYLNDEKVVAMINPPYLLGRNDANAADVARAWKAFTRRLGVTEAFTDSLGDKQHPRTYNFWGAGKKTVDGVKLRKSWRMRPPNESKVNPHPVEFEDGRLFKILAEERHRRLVLRIDDPDGDGDATVSVPSGSLLGRRQRGLGWREVHGIAHDAAYNVEETLSLTTDIIQSLCLEHLAALSKAAKGQKPPESK